MDILGHGPDVHVWNGSHAESGDRTQNSIDIQHSKLFIVFNPNIVVKM